MCQLRHRRNFRGYWSKYECHTNHLATKTVHPLRGVSCMLCNCLSFLLHIVECVVRFLLRKQTNGKHIVLFELSGLILLEFAGCRYCLVARNTFCISCATCQISIAELSYLALSPEGTQSQTSYYFRFVLSLEML